MTGPAPTRKDHEAFCETEGWTRVRDARGRPGTHHVTYELDLPAGGILRTRISDPVDRTDYGPSLWSHILRDQLQVTETEFWACVKEGTRPARGLPEPPSGALPAEVVHLLISRVGLAEAEVAAMSKDEAVTRLQRYWTDGTCS
ncbi:MAG TPA: cytotoxic translational repressor of toxin-antitoxin stability system [Streptosporangiaceae bacterium]